MEVTGVLIVSGGSVIMEFVGIFPDENSAPSLPAIQSTVQSDSRLNNSIDYLDVDQDYVTTTRKFRGILL